MAEKMAGKAFEMRFVLTKAHHPELVEYGFDHIHHLVDLRKLNRHPMVTAIQSKTCIRMALEQRSNWG